LGALLAALLYLVCLEITGHGRAAAGAALLYALGSLAWPHSRPFFTESCAAFFILLAWYALLRAEKRGHEKARTRRKSGTGTDSRKTENPSQSPIFKTENPSQSPIFRILAGG